MARHYITVTWEQLHRDARALAAKLLGQGPINGSWQGIVAVARGGLIPAAIVARELDCRLVESLCIASYDEETQGQPMVMKPPLAAGNGNNFLVIDDLADTGQTLRLVRELLPQAYIACVYVKPEGQPAADCHVSEVPQDSWILFPWDTTPQFVTPMAKAGGAGG